jgi:transcriptional regulator with XRE-family HTH domain
MEMIDDKQLRKALGGNVSRLRAAAGKSQEVLARETGVSRITLSRIENGHLTPGADILYSLADALCVPADSLRQISSPMEI